MSEEAVERVTLAMVQRAAQAGASEEDIKCLVARMSGEAMAVFTERGRGSVHVKVNRVRSVGPHWEGGTVMVFTGLEEWEDKGQLVVDEEPHKVARRLRENGWKY